MPRRRGFLSRTIAVVSTGEHTRRGSGRSGQERRERTHEKAVDGGDGEAVNDGDRKAANTHGKSGNDGEKRMAGEQKERQAARHGKAVSGGDSTR